MSKIRVFAAAVLVSIPMLSLDAAPVQVPQDAVQIVMPQDAAQIAMPQDAVQMPRDAAPRLSDGKPTTADNNCSWVYLFGFWFFLC